MQRHLIEEGVKDGFVTLTGMIAQGRGEAFDYLIGEKTTEPALLAEKAAVQILQESENRALSVNGNVAALCPQDVVKLSEALDAKIEINLFYWTQERQDKIEQILSRYRNKD